MYLRHFLFFCVGLLLLSSCRVPCNKKEKRNTSAHDVNGIFQMQSMKSNHCYKAHDDVESKHCSNEIAEQTKD